MGTTRLESVADIKKRIWREVPRDHAHDLRTVRDLRIKRTIRRPVSFLISADTNVYISDNAQGGLFKISADFESITELGASQLLYPTAIREFNERLFVYDNNGINAFQKDGQLISTTRSFLRIEDFDVIDEKSFIASISELKPDADTNFVAVIDLSGKRIDSIGEAHSFDYPEIENRAFVEIHDGLLYVGYKFHPLLEIYDLKSKVLLRSTSIRSAIFPHLLELKHDKVFMHPEPGLHRIPRFIAGIRILKEKIFVLLHTPNPQIVEYSQSGDEVGRYISSETEALDYFGFDVRLTMDTKQFFVGAIDYASKPSLVVYEENRTR